MHETCELCGGSGLITCPACQGAGEIEVFCGNPNCTNEQAAEEAGKFKTVLCPDCDGWEDTECPECAGSGGCEI